MKHPFKHAIYCLISCFLIISLAGPLSAASDKININTADVKQLSQLKRVGPGYAARIVEYREKNGAFQAPEEIMKVKGIGQKTYDVNKETIIVKEEELAKIE